MFVCRSRPDRHLLWLPVCWLCASHSQTPTPPESGHHSAHSQDDCWGNCHLHQTESPSVHVAVWPGELNHICEKLLAFHGKVWIYNRKLSESFTVCCITLVSFCVKGQQVGVYPDHSSNNEAAEIQRGCCCCGRQELAHGSGHRWTTPSALWCSPVARLWTNFQVKRGHNLQFVTPVLCSPSRRPPQEEESPDVQAPNARDVGLPGLQCVHNGHLSRGQSTLSV